MDQQGKPISDKDWQGKITIVNFFFTGCPGLCELLMKRMSQLQKQLPANTQLVSISVDPTSDTPQVLSQYAKKYSHGIANWSLHTGQPHAIQNMAREFFFAKNTKVNSETLLHNESFYLLDRALNLRGIYNGTLPQSGKDIIADVNILLNHPIRNPQTRGDIR